MTAQDAHRIGALLAMVAESAEADGFYISRCVHQVPLDAFTDLAEMGFDLRHLESEDEPGVWVVTIKDFDQPIQYFLVRGDIEAFTARMQERAA
ncbi:MAG: hypothetical protein H0V29_03895 [Thermoleophilaceae bacterium]|nr:hypothetical protein [Thermoleophilaceae bacterium]